MTPKQEKFCQKYIETGNASEAYRQAYDVENMKAETIKREACELLKDHNITATIDKLKEKHAERHKVTVDSLTNELNEDRSGARNVEQYSAAIHAVMGKAKLHGLIIDNKNITVKGSLKEILDERNRVKEDQS